MFSSAIVTTMHTAPVRTVDASAQTGTESAILMVVLVVLMLAIVGIVGLRLMLQEEHRGADDGKSNRADEDEAVLRGENR